MDTTKTQVGYMAIDQYGETYHIGNNRPRQWLLNYFGRKSTRKIYRDTKNKKVRHVGYIIAGHWLEIYRVCLWNKAS